MFGGSWGSTLGLDYTQTYPTRCLGLILRGIFLNTKAEHDAIYARKSFAGNERRLQEFDTFFELAQKEASRRNEPPLDPNDSLRFIQLYEAMILQGNREAIWRFWVFENNLMEEEVDNLLDPFVVPDKANPQYGESMSIAFFEARLFLKGTFEEPIDLLLNIAAMKKVPTWVCQGTGDEVCPEIFAQQLCGRLAEEGVPHTTHFVDSGHKASSGGMTEALVLSVQEYYDQYGMAFLKNKEQEKGAEAAERKEEAGEDDPFDNLDALRMDMGRDGTGK